MNIERELKRIQSQHKWASEQTLSRVMNLLGANTKQITKAINDIQIQQYNEKDLLKIINSQKSKIAKFTSTSKSLNEVLKTTVYGRDTNPITATSELVEMAAGAIADHGLSSNAAADGIQTVFSKIGGVATGIAGITASTAGVIAIYGQIFSEQEKVLRAGINMGVSLNTSKYTEMNTTFAGLGRSINEIFSEYRRQMPMFANLPGTAGDNLIKFANLTTVIKNDNSFPDFGYTTGQVMRRLVDEAEIIRRYGGLADMNTQSEKIVYDRFIKSSTAATVMANLLGVKRDDLLSTRQEAANDLNFTITARYAQSDLIDRYGATAYDNVVDFQTNVYTVFSTIFDGKFAKETSNLMTRAINDQNFDDVMANMSPELNQILNFMGDNVKEQYVAMIQSAVKGNLSGVDSDLAIQGFIQLVAKSTPLESIGNISDPIVQEVMEMQAQARLAPESYINATRSLLEQHRNNVAAYTESADGIVDGMDSIRRAFLQISRIASPGFGTTGDIVDGFGDTLRWLTDVIGEVLGPLVNFDPVVDDEGSGVISAPPRPSWWQSNGYIHSSPRHPQNEWDSQFGEYFSEDGTLIEGADVQLAAQAVSVGPTGATTAELSGISADPSSGGTLQNGRLPAGELQSITGGGRLRAGAADAFNRMASAAAADGVTITPSSTYRDIEKQQHLWNTSTRPLSERRKWVAYPGGSNHGWGLAFDEGNIYRQHESAPQYQWLRNHGIEYGFYQRMAHETWHWEYTGAPGTSDVTTADPASPSVATLPVDTDPVNNDATAVSLPVIPSLSTVDNNTSLLPVPVTPSLFAVDNDATAVSLPVIPSLPTVDNTEVSDDTSSLIDTYSNSQDASITALLEDELQSTSLIEQSWASIVEFFNNEETNERITQ